MTTSELQRAIGARLKHARLRRGITQTELGEHIGVSRAKIANYETGRSDIPSALLVQAAAACNVPLAIFDVLAGNGALTQIVQTLHQRPDALDFVAELLGSFPSPGPSAAQLPLPAPTRSES